MALFVRRRWPTVAAAVAVVVALAALGVFVVLRSGGDPAPRREVGFDDVLEPPSLPPETTPPAIPLAAVLAAPDAQLRTYAEQPVAATSATVLRPIGPSAAWVGDSDANRVLLVLVAVENPFSFRAGDRVTFTGTVRRGTPEFGRSVGLTGADAAEFARQGTYVEITSYVVG